MKCPKCGEGGPFTVEIKTLAEAVRLAGDVETLIGFMPEAGGDFTRDSYCSCGCGHEGAVSDFDDTVED